MKLEETIQPGAIFDNGIIRVIAHKKFVGVYDLRFAGKGTKEVNVFVLGRPVPNSKADREIMKTASWMKHARSYAQALAVAKEAIEKADAIASAEGVMPPYLHQYKQKAKYVAPAGHKDPLSMTRSVSSMTHAKNDSLLFGRMVATTADAQLRTKKTLEKKETRPVSNIIPLRQRGYTKDRTIAPAAQKPASGSRAGKSFDVFRLGQGENARVATVHADNACQAIEKAGFSYTPLYDVKKALIMMGIDERHYGISVCIGIPDKVLALPHDPADQKEVLKAKGLKKASGSGNVVPLRPKAATAPKITFKSGDSVVVDGERYAYLYRLKSQSGRQGVWDYMLVPLFKADFTYNVVHSFEDIRKGSGKVDAASLVQAVDNLYRQAQTSPIFSGDHKRKIEAMYKKFVGTTKPESTDRPKEKVHFDAMEFAIYDTRNAGKIVAREKTTENAMAVLKFAGYTPEPFGEKVKKILKDAGLGFMTYGNHIAIDLESEMVSMLPYWSPAWDKAEKEAIKGSFVKLFRGIQNQHTDPVQGRQAPAKKGGTQVAETILKQLGGNRFRVMTGAKEFIADGKMLMFRIPKANRGINHVRITLAPSDTYTVEFGRKRSMNYKVISTFKDIYNDQLQDLFERETGLYTSL